MLKIVESNPFRPIRTMVYGVEGVGKSTLGAKSDRPVFITPEGGIDQLTDSEGNPCKSISGLTNWSQVMGAIDALRTEDHDFKTVVLDSADWLEKLAHKEVIGDSGKSIITARGGYGNGYRMSENMHRELIEKLEDLRDNRDMNIIVTAHAHVKPVKDPDMLDDYDCFEIKCHEMVSSLYREWVDALLFARFRTYIKTDKEGSGKKSRALSDGTRVVYTQKQPAFQAKNRYGLPPEMDFTENFWNELVRYARNVKPPTAEKIREGILSNLKRVMDDDLKKKVSDSVKKAGNGIEQLTAIGNRLEQITGERA